MDVQCFTGMIAATLLLALSGCDARSPIGAAQIAASGACTPADISVEVHGSRVEYDYAFVTGRIINNCKSATGVQVKFTLYDSGGGILKSDDIWPASVNNIPAGADFPFEHQTEMVGQFSRVEARVIAVREW